MKKIKKISLMVYMFLLITYNRCFADIILPDDPNRPKNQRTHSGLLGNIVNHPAFSALVALLVLAIISIVVILLIVMNTKKNEEKDGNTEKEKDKEN